MSRPELNQRKLTWVDYAYELEAKLERTEAIVERMLPHLREHLTNEYIWSELIKGDE